MKSNLGRRVIGLAPPPEPRNESQPTVAVAPVKPVVAPRRKPSVTRISKAQLAEDLKRNPDHARLMLDQYYRGRLVGVTATDILQYTAGPDVNVKAEVPRSVQALAKFISNPMMKGVR